MYYTVGIYCTVRVRANRTGGARGVDTGIDGRSGGAGKKELKPQ